MTDVRELLDDTGRGVRVPATVRRVVSLVPSLTESVAVTAPALLVGATRWCTHPASLDVVRIDGTKNPDVPRVVALRPDLVLANFEENRAVDLDALRDAGVPVWVTRCTTVPEAFESLTRVFGALALGVPGWLDAARSVWSAVRPARRRDVVVPIWRRPWMVLGRDTFAGDLLARRRAPSCCRTSRTRSRRTTGPRRSPVSTSRSSAAVTSPGTDRRSWTRPAVLAAQLSATGRR